MQVLGIDEVGRGCWAGPLVAGAVILGSDIKGLKDSKKLTKVHREELAQATEASALDYGLGWVWPAEIDKLGLTEAVRLAMRRALNEIKMSYDEIIIDGNYNYFLDNPKAKAVIKADDLVPAVSAASIIAKVARDKFMSEQAVLFPNYGFDHHVGYGTQLHQEMLKLYGICDLHRRSYGPIKELLA